MSPREQFRAHGRLPVHIDAVLRRQDASLPVVVRNLGFGGAGLEIADPTTLHRSQAGSRPFDLSAGRDVTLEIIAPVLWDPLLLQSIIVWSKPASKLARVGIKFEPLGRAALLSIFDIVTSH